jgi:hypothetical protein
MTVITKPLSQQEKEKKDEIDEKPIEEVALSGEGKTLVDVESATVISPSSSKKPNSSNMCLVVTVLLATCLALTILGYHHLRQQHQRFNLRRGTCRLPCHMKRQQQLCSRRSNRLTSGEPNDVLSGEPPKDGAALVLGDFGYWHDQGSEKPLVRTDIELDESREMETETLNEDGTFELMYEMDLEEETFELIQMPDVSSGLYVHDFTVNRTAIIEDNRCFVMVMDRNEIAPPRNLLDILVNTKDGYELDLDEIQHDMMIVLPELTPEDLFKEYGYFIGRACHDKTAYKLVPVPEEIAALQNLDNSMQEEMNELEEVNEILDNPDQNVEPELENFGRNKRSVSRKTKMFKELSKKLVTYRIVNFEAL